MEFEAEIKRTSQRKAVSLDNVYEVLFATDNPMILDLGKLGSDTLVMVSVAIIDKPKHNVNQDTPPIRERRLKVNGNREIQASRPKDKTKGVKKRRRPAKQKDE